MDRFDLPVFKFKQMPSSEVRHEWSRYKRQFEYQALANAVTNRTRLKHIFLAKAGPDVQEVFDGIPGADVEEAPGVDPLAVAIEKLDNYFAPKQHDAFQRYQFWALKPKDKEETAEKFLHRSMEVAARCNFGSTKREAQEISVIDKTIQQASPSLFEKLLQKEKLTLDDVTKTVAAHESVKTQARQMASAGERAGTSSEVNRVQSRRIQLTPKRKCYRCGQSDHLGTDESCPAREAECDRCEKKGHYAKCCKSKISGQSKDRSKFRLKRRIKNETGKKENKVEKSQEPSHKRAKYDKTVRAIEYSGEGNPTSFIFNIDEGDALMWVTIGGVLMQILVDSGCEKNIIDDISYEAMKKQNVQVRNQRLRSEQSFRAYGRQASPMTVKEVFESDVEVRDQGTNIKREATFYVVEGGSQPLLGRVTSKALGVLTVGLPSTQSPEIYRLYSEQKHPFPKMKNIKLHIPIDTTVTPVCQHARRPPLALLDKIEDKLNSLLAADIIERVTEYSPWISPLVTIVKDNGDLRLCVDMRQANVAIQRETHLMPTFEDILPRLKQARVFSRLDVKDAFHQVELDEGSRFITTFITHKGIYRYKRLMFGLSSAPESYQKVMEQTLAGCDNVVNYIDDILVYGKDEQEHDAALEKVMNVLKANNVLLNHQKCVFRTDAVVFLGHHISANGIRPADDKIASITSFWAPKSKDELRSFLGLITYVGKFLPDLATLCATLRALLKADTPFEWNESHEKTFQKLKSMVTNAVTLKYFDNSLRTRVVADASPVGLGAVLIQFKTDSDVDPRIICFASKSLSSTERRYCQTEKEALALVWAVERFTVYLLGRRFELETDHKPLEVIFSPKSKPCARIERWVLRLQAYTYFVKYRKGSTNIADPFSRLLQDREGNDFDKDSPFLVLAVMQSAAIDTNELEIASRSDPELSLVRESLQNGKWEKAPVKSFEPFRNELGLVGDMLVRGNKLVIPQQLQDRMMELAHEGHPGETVMKRRLRDRVWWPGMDRDISKCVINCKGCRLVGLPSRPEPMTRRQLPAKPWIDVAIDFMGPIPSGENLLVIVDYYSRYKEVEIMKQITAEETIKRLHRIFTRLGYPMTITLDNARQFASSKFDQYCKDHGIALNYSTPYWPQENGLVERQNRSLLKRLQISHALGRDWKSDLQDYLMMYYTTPHSVTGKTPTELCYGRSIRSKIPSLGDIESAPVDTEFRERDQLQKQKGKEKEDRNRRATPSEIQVGDKVLLKNLLPGNKLTTKFNPAECVVVDKSGSRLTVQNNETKKTYQRNTAHVKRIPDNDTEHSISSGDGVTGEPNEEPSPSTSTTTNPKLTSDSSRIRRELKAPAKLKDYLLYE